MSKVKVKYDDDFKKNAVRLSYASPKSISDVAADLPFYVGTSKRLNLRTAR